MKTKLLFTIVALLALGQVVNGQGTAFTYQGQLTDNGTPANGSYDLRFTIYDGLSGGNQVGNRITNAAVPVAEGTFTVILDFGAGIFTGANRWLEIGVRTNGPAGAFTTLSPLQAFTAAPYAITAGAVTDANVSRLDVPNTSSTATGVPTVTSGFITAATVLQSGLGYQSPPTVTVTDTNGSGAVIVATVLAGKVVALTVQNSGTGYSSGATLTISSPPSNAFQTFITPNFFTGINTMTNPGNTFAGSFTGDGTRLTNVDAATLEGLTTASFWQLGGNGGSAAGLNFLGTTDNQALELKVNSTRALRLEPNTNGAPNVIAGSPVNTVAPGVVGATISGGHSNTIAGFYATIPGGYLNTAAGNYSFAAGNLANANHAGAFVWADHSLNTGFTSTATNQFLVRAAGGVGIGTNAPQAPFHVVGPGQVVALVDSANPTGTWLSIANRSTGGGSWSLISTGNGNGEGADKLVFFTSAASFGRMNLDASGNLALVGTLSAGGAVVGTLTATTLSATTLSAATVGIGLSNPAGALGVAVGTGAVTVRNDGNVPGLVLTGGIAPGTLRLRNALEIWPNDAANAGGRLDVRGLNGSPTITLTGTNGTVSAVTYVQTSDRNAKENFTSVDRRQMLEKVVALPITRWTFKDDTGTAHVGPMAQDFYSAFSLGTDEKHIATVDEEGVALAALQGLNQKVEERSARIKELEARIERLERLLSAKDQVLK